MKLRSVAAALFALASFAGCKPAVHGRCNTTRDCRQGAYCAVSGICLSRSGTCAPACGDGQICSSSVCVALKPPTVGVFVPVAADAVNGWVPRTAGTLEVRASVDAGAGAGAPSATLSFDTCPASEACSYSGTVLSQSGGVTVFSFTVPRAVQAAGSEAPLDVTVKVQDVAGNRAQGTGTVKIDDAPPQIGALGLVSAAGVTGEDGKTWFVGGPNAPDVELSVPVADSGVGLSSLTLHLTDVAGPDPTPLPQSDGTVHFMLPASRVVGREGALHFTLTAADLLNHKVTTPPDNIWVDASAPVFTRPHVDYASALPASACAPEVLNTFNCGRRSPASHALRDDTVTVTFDGFDCGAGLANSGSPFSLLVTSGGQTKPVNVQQQPGKDNGTCTNGNRVHHFSVQLALGTAATALGAPSADGTVQVQLASSGPDLMSNPGQSPAGAASPEGIALLSLWRWKIKLNAIASGSPALLPGPAGSRTVVVGTTATAGANLFAVGPDGTQPWSALLLPGISGDVAVGQSGTVYASTGTGCLGASATCTAVNAVTPPSGSTATGTPVACTAGNANFGASSAVVSSGGGDLLYAIALSRGPGASNLFVFSPGATCTQQGTGTIVTPIADDATGISAGGGAAFVSNGHGFTSLDENGTGFGTQVTYDAGATGLVTPAPPSFSSASAAGGAIFGTAGGDQRVRRTVRQSGGCSLPGACWKAASGFPPTPPPTPSNLPFTPAFDGQTIWAIDDQGVVFTWAQQGGAAGPFLDLNEAASPPVLVQGGSALEVTVSGMVKLLSASTTPMSSQRLLALGAATFPAKVPAPVIDCGGATCSGSGVAYVPAPDNWVWAVQLPAAPVAASSTAWPRPGHDSCNTRNATADASKCP